MSVHATTSPQPGGGAITTFEQYPEIAERPESSDEFERPFPIDLLPSSLRAIIEESARLFLLPCELPAALALGTLSAALGQGVVLRNPPHSTAGNLFFLLSAPSGTGKSNCFRFITHPLFDAERRRIERFNAEERPRLKAEEEAIEAKITAIKRDLSKPRAKVSADEEQNLRDQLTQLVALRERVETSLNPARVIVEDATSQRMAMLMAQSGETIALLSSDAGDVVSNILGRWNRTQRSDDALLLKAFSRDPFTQDRIGRPPVALASPCACAVLIVTPDELTNLFSVERLSSGGLLPRFLVLPSAARPKADVGDREPQSEIVDRWNQEISVILDTFRFRNGEPCEVTLAGDAGKVFSRFRNDDFVSRFDEIADIAPFIARHSELAARVALVLHVSEHGAHAPSFPLSVARAEDAVTLVGWFAARQLAFMQEGRRIKMAEEVRRLVGLIERGPVSLRNLRDRHNFEPDRVRVLAREFSHLLTVETLKSGNPAGGRPSDVLRLTFQK